jgi:hypothetical protein
VITIAISSRKHHAPDQPCRRQQQDEQHRDLSGSAIIDRPQIEVVKRFRRSPAPRRVEAMSAGEASIAAAGRLMAGPLP